MKSKNCELTQHGNSALHEAAWRDERIFADGDDPDSTKGQRQCRQSGRFHAASSLLPEWTQRNVSGPPLGRRQSRRQKSRKTTTTTTTWIYMNIHIHRYVDDDDDLFLFMHLVWWHTAAHEWTLRSRGSYAHPGQRPVQRLRAEQGNNNNNNKRFSVIFIVFFVFNGFPLFFFIF